MDKLTLLQIAGATLGLLYLYLEYKVNIYLWVVGLVMPVVHGYLYFEKGLYADMGMNVYYILAGIYGWIVWKNNKPKNKHTHEISRTPLRLWLYFGFVFFAAFAAITYILVEYTDSTVPYADAFTTALSIIAMWMLSRKYVEQWLVWLVVDVVTSCLYFYKNTPITASLYVLYSCMAIAGYMRWYKIMKKQI